MAHQLSGANQSQSSKHLPSNPSHSQSSKDLPNNPSQSQSSKQLSNVPSQSQPPKQLPNDPTQSHPSKLLGNASHSQPSMTLMKNDSTNTQGDSSIQDQKPIQAHTHLLSERDTPSGSIISIDNDQKSSSPQEHKLLVTSSAYSASHYTESASQHKKNAKSFDYKDGLDLVIFIGTFNANAKNPKGSFQEWLKTEDEPDIYAIGCQEVVNLNAFNMVTPAHMSRPWENKLKQEIPKKYCLISSKQLVGILLVIFVRRELLPYISSIQFDTVGVGFLNVGGNKGGVAIRIHIFDTRITFINSHLAAHKDDVEARNANFHSISERIHLHNYKNKLQTAAYEARKEGTFRQKDSETETGQGDYMFWFGDLNYRLNFENLDDVHRLIEEKGEECIPELLKADQLKDEMRKGNVFKGFKEGPIRFMPTYKFQPKTDLYERRPKKKKRFPAWCDRILWLKSRGITQAFYRRSMVPRYSDHKPVSALFFVKGSISPYRAFYIPPILSFLWDILDSIHFIVLCGQTTAHIPHSDLQIVPYSKLVQWSAVFALSFSSPLSDTRNPDLAVEDLKDTEIGLSLDINPNMTGMRGYCQGVPGFFSEQNKCDQDGLLVNTMLNFALLLIVYTVIQLLIQLFVFIGARLRRRFRLVQAKLYPFWRYRGGLLRLTISFYYIFLVSTIYEFSSPSSRWEKLLLASIMMIICLGIPAYALWKVYRVGRFQSIWPSEYTAIEDGYNQCAIFKNKEMRLKFGAIYFQYNENNSFFIIAKLIYYLFLAIIVGSLSDIENPLPQHVSLLIIQVVFTGFLIKRKPYEATSKTRLQGMLHIGRCLNLLILFFFLKIEPFTLLKYNDYLEIIAICIHLASLLGILFDAGYTVYNFSSKRIECPCCKKNSLISTNEEEGEEEEDDDDTDIQMRHYTKEMELEKKNRGTIFGMMERAAGITQSEVKEEVELRGLSTHESSYEKVPPVTHSSASHMVPPPPPEENGTSASIMSKSNVEKKIAESSIDHMPPPEDNSQEKVSEEEKEEKMEGKIEDNIASSKDLDQVNINEENKEKSVKSMIQITPPVVLPKNENMEERLEQKKLKSEVTNDDSSVVETKVKITKAKPRSSTKAKPRSSTKAKPRSSHPPNARLGTPNNMQRRITSARMAAVTLLSPVLPERTATTTDQEIIRKYTQMVLLPSDNRPMLPSGAVNLDSSDEESIGSIEREHSLSL